MSKKALTERAMAANRENAKRSTGPKTDSGKSHSRLNAIKHGLLSRGLNFADDAQREEHAALLAQFLRDAQPTTLQEVLLVEEVVACFWKLMHAFAWETNALKSRHTTARLFLKAMAAQCVSTSGLDPSEFSAEADGIDVDSITISRREDELDGQEKTVGVRLTSSLGTSLRYEAAIKRDLHRAIDQLEKLQGRRCSTAGT
jgi:hypothetical protein